LIGISAKILYPEISPEQAFPQIIKEALPSGLNAIVLAALLAALMSSADTCLLSQSIILTEDILKNLYSLNEKKTLLLTRINLIILGLIALALTFKGVISSLLFAYTIFTCGLVIPAIAGFYKEKLKLSSKGALSALIGGGTVGLLGKIPHLNVPFKEYLPLMGIVVCTILLFGVSFITREKT
jgi:SSS family solute:Na+ symporter